GTWIYLKADPRDVPSTKCDPRVIAERLESKAYLHGGLTIEFVDETSGTSHSYHYEDGLSAYLAKIVNEAKQLPIGGEVFTIHKEQDGLVLDCALAWTEDTAERVQSYVNGIPTTAGGAHENGLKGGIGKAI